VSITIGCGLETILQIVFIKLTHPVGSLCVRPHFLVIPFTCTAFNFPNRKTHSNMDYFNLSEYLVMSLLYDPLVYRIRFNLGPVT
jgi:hypothetical protein